MADGDITTLRIPITFDKTTDDGTTKVIEAAATFTVANFDILTSQILVNNITKEGLTEATIVIVARAKA